MEIPINYTSWNGGTNNNECALVDSRATKNFLNFCTIMRWRLPMQKLQNPQQIFNVDGTENKLRHVEKFCHLNVGVGPNQQMQTFFVTNLGQDRVILRYPWLKHFNLQLNWKAGVLDNDQTVKIEVAPWCKAAKEAAQQLLCCHTSFTTTGPHIAQQWAIQDVQKK
jgi:hypothetical protein